MQPKCPVSFRQAIRLCSSERAPSNAANIRQRWQLNASIESFACTLRRHPTGPVVVLGGPLALHRNQRSAQYAATMVTATVSAACIIRFQCPRVHSPPLPGHSIPPQLNHHFPSSPPPGTITPPWPPLPGPWHSLRMHRRCHPAAMPWRFGDTLVVVQCDPLPGHTASTAGRRCPTLMNPSETNTAAFICWQGATLRNIAISHFGHQATMHTGHGQAAEVESPTPTCMERLRAE
jgi:hypothetical protein